MTHQHTEALCFSLQIQKHFKYTILLVMALIGMTKCGSGPQNIREQLSQVSGAYRSCGHPLMGLYFGTSIGTKK